MDWPQEPMPPEAQAIGEAAWAAVRRTLTEAFEKASALPGDPARVENQALSIVSQTAAAAGVHFIGRVVECKGIHPETAWAPALTDLQIRMREILQGAVDRASVH